MDEEKPSIAKKLNHADNPKGARMIAVSKFVTGPFYIKVLEWSPTGRFAFLQIKTVRAEKPIASWYDMLKYDFRCEEILPREEED